MLSSGSNWSSGDSWRGSSRGLKQIGLDEQLRENVAKRMVKEVAKVNREVFSMRFSGKEKGENGKERSVK